MTYEQLHEVDKRFYEFWPSISVGYDGSEADAMKRDAAKSFLHAELARQNEEHQALIFKAEQECKIAILEQLLPHIVYPHDQREIQHLLKKLKAGNK